MKRFGLGSISKVLLLCLILCTHLHRCADSNSDEVFHKDIELHSNSHQNVNIYLGSILSERPDLSVHKNTLVVQVQNKVLNKGSTPLNHLIDVSAKLVSANYEEEPVDIKDIVVQKEDADMILHYIVYDMCNVDDSSYVQLHLEATDGDFEGFVSMIIVDLEAFSIKCTDKESEKFISREQHTACETWDKKIWVFGGRKSVGKDLVVMNDLMFYDADLNKWNGVKPTHGQQPSARYGHVMMCYFQYLVVFGGQNKAGKALGDLWVFDTIVEKWNFIMDTADTHELKHLGLVDDLPTPRMFAAATMVPEIGAGYITGGFTNTGVACDVWGLRVDKVVSFSPSDSLSNYWVKKIINHQDNRFLCREGHSMAMINPETFVVYGGLDENKEFNHKIYTYQVIKNNIQILTTVGEEPDTRIRQGVLSAGGGMVILYGGANIEGKGYYIDLWHFVVNDGMVEFKQMDYQQEGDNLFMTWRHGFTMHYVRGMQDPVLIGGTYGNNQQSNALVSLPEKKCKDLFEFAQGFCTPCPVGSVYRADMCKWCTREQFFKENSQNYFASECRNCPLGLVGGNYKACVPCPGGYIFTLDDRETCSQCESNEVCPLGTRYAFPSEGFSENFIEVRLDSHPDLFNPHKRPFDHTSIIVIFACIFLSLMLFIFIGIALNGFKERSLFVLREIDLPFITGGDRRRVVGGVIMLFFLLVVTIVTFGFLINFFLFNTRTVVYETNNPFTNKAYPASYQFKFMLYTSRFIESTDPSGDNDEEAFNKPLPNLCKNHKISFSMSRYFGQAEDVNKQFTCARTSLASGTDEYTLILSIKDIKDEAPNNAFIRIEVDSEYEQIFHFFKWEYWNIWRFYESYPLSYSKVSGFITPQMTTKSNKNITAAFRGPASTKLNFKLTPTHYGNEIESQNFEGYQVYLDEYIRGSIVDERNMANSILSSGSPSKGFSIEVFSDVTNKINHVEVQRVKSILEVIAYIFGFTAGFIIIAHLLKYFLSKEEYFKGLDRECDTLFGSLEQETVKLNRAKNSSEITLKDMHDTQ